MKENIAKSKDKDPEQYEMRVRPFDKNGLSQWHDHLGYVHQHDNPNRRIRFPHGGSVTSKNWIEKVFNSKAAQTHGVVRRKLAYIEKIVGKDAMLQEVKKRGFHIVEVNDQWVFICKEGHIATGEDQSVFICNEND